MSQLSQIDYKSSNASVEFAQSLVDTGFAVIKNHTIDPKLISDVFEEWKQFFADESKND